MKVTLRCKPRLMPTASLPNHLQQPNPMKLLLALLAGLALAAYILALADGPSLIDIINKY